MFRNVCFYLVILVLVCTFSSAQRPANPPSPTGVPRGMPGTPTGGLGRTTEPSRSFDLVVHAVYADDHPAGENLQVSLEAVTGGVVATAYTNSEGQATFSNLHSGSYVITVKGTNIKDVSSEQIVLDSFNNHGTQYVYVQPLNGDQEASGKAKGGVVSAADLNAPPKARKEFEKGNEAFAKGDTKKAAEAYQKATELYPKFASAYNNLGAVYMKSDDKVHAREVWEKALDADPMLPTANVNLAKMNMVGKDYKAAIPFLEKALSANPKLPEALLLMAHCKLLTGDMDQALLYARKVHEIGDHTKFEMSHLIAGRALEVENHAEQARIEYELLLKEAPACPEAAEAQKSLARIDSVAKKQ